MNGFHCKQFIITISLFSVVVCSNSLWRNKMFLSPLIRSLTKHDWKTVNVPNCVKSAKCLVSVVTRNQSTSVLDGLAHISKDHDRLYKLSVDDPDLFWGTLARDKLKWIDDFHTVQSSNMVLGKHEWFQGGKLNVSGNVCFTFTFWETGNVQYFCFLVNFHTLTLFLCF